jgi:PKD repeat protein
MIIVNVAGELTAAFEAQPSAIVANEPVTFENTSTGGENWYWELGDGTSSVDESPQNLYDNSFIDEVIQISLIASNSIGCSDTSIQQFVVVSARFDLAVTNIFVEDQDGYYVVGVQLKNVGTSLIESADVELRLNNGTVIYQAYNDTLQSGQSAIMIFDSYPSSFISDQDEVDAWICADGTPFSALNLPDEDPSNNRYCRNVEGEEPVLIGPNPNPASEHFVFSILVTKESVLSVDLIDARGRIVRTFLDETSVEEGLYSYTVSLLGVNSGVYFLRMNNEVKRVVVE